MKKFIVFLLICFCACPGFAQRGKGVRDWFRALRLQRSVAQTVTQTAASSSSGIYWAKVANLPGMPLVQVRLPSRPAAPTDGVLSARVLPPSQVYHLINLERTTQLYVPRAFAEQDKALYRALYRGVRLTNLNDLQNILENGMEIKKSRFSAIYSSYSLGDALGYALPPYEWLVYENIGEIDLELPVVVKIPVTIRLIEKNTPYDDMGDVIFRQDLWADMISDVMVFLEIDGKADWYKAVLEDKKLLLIPTPTKRVSGWVEALF